MYGHLILMVWTSKIKFTPSTSTTTELEQSTHYLLGTDEKAKTPFGNRHKWTVWQHP